MSAINNLEFLNKNSHRSYPLKEGTTQTDVTGSYVLVKSFLVDMVWVIDVNKALSFFIKYLSILPDVINGQLYDSEDRPAATFTIDVSAHTVYKAYELVGIGTYANSIGKIVVGDLDPILAEPLGLFTFSLLGTECESRTVIPSIRGVTGISKLPSGDTTFPVLTGNVKFANGINTRPSVDVATNSIRIDAIEGEGLGLICDCEEEDAAPPCIAYINGIPPDASKNFNIQGIGCIVVTGIENGIQIENTCVTNCCSCDDIDALEARIEAAEEALGI